MRKFIWLLLAVAVLAGWSCGEEKKEKEKTATTRPVRKARPKPKRIPPEQLWQVSTKATSQDEYDIKRRRRAKDGKEPTLKDLIDLSQSFFSRIQPIQATDSVLKFRGFDLEFFVPAMERFSNDDFHALYRRGSEKSPGAISIVDSIGPNNIDVFPFYVDHLILFFVHFHGEDESRQNPLVVPGFFVNDFEGKGTVYFQPHPNRPLKDVKDLASVMLLKSHLIPEKRLGLKEGHVETYSLLSWRDSTSKEVRYSLRHGRPCDVEYVTPEMTLPDLVTALKKRCGGANRSLLPQVKQGRVPLWTEGPDYPYELVQPERRRALSEEDSLAKWAVDAGGGQRRAVDREAVLPPVAKMIQTAAGFAKKIKRPAPDAQLYLGAGVDFRKMTVNPSKPGHSPRSALFHSNKDGEEDFIMLIDSSQNGFANLDIYPFITPAAVYYFVDYYGADPGHSEAQRIPGFFVFPHKLRTNFYFAPSANASITTMKDIGMVMQLDQDLFPKSALILQDGDFKQHISYDYAPPEGKRYDFRLNEMEVTPIQRGEDCELAAWDSKLEMEVLRKVLRRPGCGGEKVAQPVPKNNPYHPIWIWGSGLEKPEKSADENEKTS